MGVYSKDIVRNTNNIETKTYNSPIKNNTKPKDEKIEEVFDLNKELQASASNIKVSIDWYILGLISIIILGLVSVVLIKNNKKEGTNIEDGLSSDDFKIIE